MPIEYGSPAYAQAVMGAAIVAQQRIAGERAAERAHQLTMQRVEITARQELVQFEAEMRLQAAKVAQAWELEKMQRESELDFQMLQQEVQLKHTENQRDKLEAKKRYAAYVDHIDSDNTKSPKEKQQAKNMAYDQMVAKVDMSDRLYFPEQFERPQRAPTMEEQIDRLLHPEDYVDKGKAETVSQVDRPTAQIPGTSELVSAIKEIQQTNPQISDVDLLTQGRSLAKTYITQNITARLMEESGGTISREQLLSQAARLADIELEAQQDRMRAHATGITPGVAKPTPKIIGGVKVTATPGAPQAVTTRETPAEFQARQEEEKAARARQVIRGAPGDEEDEFAWRVKAEVTKTMAKPKLYRRYKTRQKFYEAGHKLREAPAPKPRRRKFREMFNWRYVFGKQTPGRKYSKG